MSPNETERLILGAPGARALLIGSGRHLPGSGLEDVPAVSATITDLGRCLVERAGLDSGHLTTLIDPEGPQEVGDALVAVAAEATGALLVHYAGHGLVSAGNELHLATRRSRLGLDRGLPEHQALPYPALRQALRGSTAPLIVVILDCCFAGRAQTLINIATEDAPAGMYLLAGANAHQYAWAPPGERYTAFTGALIELLTRGDPVAPRLLTLDDMYRSLSRTLTDRGFPRPRRHAADVADRQPLAPNPAYGNGSSGARVGEFSPYRGLAAFGPDDSRFFFGREQLTATLVDRVAEQLERPGPLMVVGPSGAGKTSLLHAGLIPALRRASTPVASLVPGRDPRGALAGRLSTLFGVDPASLDGDPAGLRASLPAPAHRPVLVVDQFEAVFERPLEEQRAFVKALHALCSEPLAEAPAVVVIGMRADFFGHASDHPELMPGLQQPVVVAPMTTEQLRRAVEGPAGLADLDLQKGLTEAMLEDLGVSAQESAAAVGGLLPLLSHALLTTWHNLEGRTMTLAGYHATGGIAQSLARTADATLDRLDLPGRTMARRLLPRMVNLGEDSRDTGRSILLADLLPPASSPEHAVAREVLEQFTRARLLTVDASSVQIAHEALIRSWPRLRLWIEADRAPLLAHQRIGDDARTWVAKNRDPAYLYRGNRLAEARRARTQWEGDPSRYPPLSQTIAEFLDASGAADARAGRRARRTRVALTVSLTVAVLGSFIGAGFALDSARRVQDQRASVLSAQLAALSGSLATADPRTSRLLSAAALDFADTSEARQSALNALANRTRALLTGHFGLVRAVALGQVDGRPIAVSGGEDHTVRLWDLRTAQPLGAPMKGHTDSIGAVAMGEVDGVPVAVSGSEDGTVRVWDARTGRPRGAPLTGHEGGVGAITAGVADGTPVVISGGRDGTVRSWNLRTREPLGSPLPTLGTFVGSLALTSLDGLPVAVAGTDTGLVQSWNLRTGEEITPALTGGGSPVSALAAGELNGVPVIVSGSDDGTVRVWDLKKREQLGEPMIAHQGYVGGLAVGPVDGPVTAVSGGQDGSVRVWDLATRRQLGDDLAGHVGPIGAIALGELDGRPIAVSAGDDATLRVWNLRAPGQSGPPVAGREGAVEATAISWADGVPVAVSAREDATLQVFDLKTRKPIGKPMTGHDGIVWALASGEVDGRSVVVSSGEDGTVRAWDPKTGRQIGPAMESSGNGPIGAVAMTTVDGLPVAVSGGDDTTIRLWNLRSMRAIGEPLEGHGGFVGAVDATSLDGLPVAVTGGKDGTLRLWDLRARKELAPPLAARQGEIKAIATTRLGTVPAAVSVGQDGTVRVWDLRSRKQLGAPMTGHNGVVYAVATGQVDGVPIAVTAGQDGTVRTWDLRSRKARGVPLLGHRGPVYGVAMGRGLAMAVSGERDDGALRVWDLATPPDLEGAICAQAQGPLTREEWQTYLPADEPYRQICA